MTTIVCPVFINIPRKTKKDKKVNLNQNTFHTLHYHDYAKAKQLFYEQIYPQIKDMWEIDDAISLIFTYYHGRKVLGDLSNHCVIVDKFFSDCLVQAWIIPSDDYTVIKEVMYSYGGYDKDKDRVEVSIVNLNSF